jgi:hypothetical protein
MTQPCSDPDPSVGMSGHHDRMPSSLPEQPEHNPRPRMLYKRTKPCFTRDGSGGMSGPIAASLLP